MTFIPEIINSKEALNFIKNNPVKLIDAGASLGLSDPWSKVKNDRLLTLGFEPDIIEYEKLSKENKLNSKYFPFALWDKKERIKLYLANEPSTSSVFPPNHELLDCFYDPLPFVRKTKEIVELDAIDIDSIAKQENLTIDFIKIDTHGAELQILKGATNTLKNVLGIHAELWTKEIHKGQKLTGEFIHFAETMGFRIFEIDGFGQWYRQGKSFIEQFPKRELIAADILFFKEPEFVSNEFEKEQLLKLAFIVDLYGYPQYALSLLDKLIAFRWKKEEMELLKQMIILNWKIPQAGLFKKIKRNILKIIESSLDIEIKKRK